MAKDTFPIQMTHPKVKGTTRAASPTSLRVLKRNGWKPVTDSKPADTPSEPTVTSSS